MIRRLIESVARSAALAVALASLAAPVLAQGAPPRVEGTWEGELGGTAFVVIIRADSSASLGDQTVRYRLMGDSLQVALGGQWFTYSIAYGDNVLTISGGDLIEPISLRYAGPPTPRPDSIPVPPAPDGSPR